ncbi:MAG: hypothetical protein JWQ40_2172 [Segetibacter sp.]|nr:hypothetical protein [Segetibacter sp.]
MFCLISGLPSFAIGIKLQGKVTKEDFENVLIPALKKASAEWKGINLLLVMETEFRNFTAGAWLNDAKVNVRYFLKWNKIGMVTKEESIRNTFGLFDFIIPGEVKMFSYKELQEAKDWISEP